MGRSPRPLKIVSSQVSGDIHYLSDEEEAGHVAGFHRLGGEVAGGDAAAGDFGFVEALGAGGVEAPVVEAGLEL